MQGKGEPCGPRPSTLISVWRRARNGGRRRHWGRPALKKAKIASSPIATTKRIEHRSWAARSAGPLRAQQQEPQEPSCCFRARQSTPPIRQLTRAAGSGALSAPAGHGRGTGTSRGFHVSPAKWKLERARPHDLSCAGCDNASLIRKREETSWAKICHSAANL